MAGSGGRRLWGAPLTPGPPLTAVCRTTSRSMRPALPGKQHVSQTPRRRGGDSRVCHTTGRSMRASRVAADSAAPRRRLAHAQGTRSGQGPRHSLRREARGAGPDQRRMLRRPTLWSLRPGRVRRRRSPPPPPPLQRQSPAVNGGDSNGRGGPGTPESLWCAVTLVGRNKRCKSNPRATLAGGQGKRPLVVGVALPLTSESPPPQPSRRCRRRRRRKRRRRPCPARRAGPSSSERLLRLGVGRRAQSA